MKRYNLGSINTDQYEFLTDEERLAWLNPEPYSYHSLHIERMGADTFRWRDSQIGAFYIGSSNELLKFLPGLKLRKLDPKYSKAVGQAQILTILSQAEIYNLFSDL